MCNVFTAEISGMESWGKVFQSIPVFERLICKICAKENLACNRISNLTAGTNAVFRVDDYVLKIFAPSESGFDSENDFVNEMIGMKRAIVLGINIPNVLAASYIEDKYFFRYIITDYINGTEAKDIIYRYSVQEKINFVRQIKANLNKINTAVTEQFRTLEPEHVLSNTRWNELPNDVAKQIKDFITNRELSGGVYVHGDITGDNVLIDPTGKLYIIDFADGRIAPKEYEYPPILFDLFNFDKVMIREFIGTEIINKFADECFFGILMHEFGFIFVKLICQRIIGIDSEELTDIKQVKHALYDFFVKTLQEV